MGADQIVDRVQVRGDVVADRGVRTATGLHGRYPILRQHGVCAQEVGVLGGVDVVGEYRQRQLVAQLSAQRGHQSGLPRANRAADADAQRLPGCRIRFGRSTVRWLWECAGIVSSCSARSEVSVSKRRQQTVVDRLECSGRCWASKCRQPRRWREEVPPAAAGWPTCVGVQTRASRSKRLDSADSAHGQQPGDPPRQP